MTTIHTPNTGLHTPRGLTLIEIMVVLAIFSIVMAALYSGYSVQTKMGIREYRLARSEMEYQIAKTLMERDLTMAGYGIADDYSAITPSFNPSVVAATDGNPDTLTLVGTALGRESRASQAWSYVLPGSAVTTTAGYHQWNDARENLKTSDLIVYMDPNTKKLLALSATTNGMTGKSWLFPYPAGTGSNPVPDAITDGDIVMGLLGGGLDADFPYYVVSYSLGGTPPPTCAPGALNLMRLENRRNPPNDASPQPLLNCVLDFQVALGLDTNEDGLIDCWDNGGVTAAGYTNDVLRTRLKEIKAYVLIQQGNQDVNNIGPPTIRVGDSSLTSCAGTGVGRAVTLTAQQKQYPWTVISLSVTPRNIR